MGHRKDFFSYILYFSSCTSMLQLLTLISCFTRATVCVLNSPREISYLPALGNLESCTTSKNLNGKVMALCQNYKDIPRNITNSSVIEILDMSHGNEIHTLTEDQLIRPQLYNLIELILKSCKIQTIEKGAFRYLHLFHLDLSENRIEFLNPEIFNGMSKLRVLDLRKNPIKKFETGKVFPEGLFQLTSLELSHCHLESLPENAFDNLWQLEGLFLDNNRFKTVNWRTFRKVVWTLTNLTLYGNPWHCDCHTLFLIQTIFRAFTNTYFQKDLYSMAVNPNTCATSSNANSLVGFTWRVIGWWNYTCSPEIETLQLKQYDNQGTESGKMDFSTKNLPSVEVMHDVSIECTVFGYPNPNLKWKKDDNKIEWTTDKPHYLSDPQISNVNSSVDQSYEVSKQCSTNVSANVFSNDEMKREYTCSHFLIIRNATKKDEGRYTCYVSNRAGSTQKTVALNFTEQSVQPELISENHSVAPETFIWIGFAFFVPVSLITLLVWWRYRSLNRQYPQQTSISGHTESQPQSEIFVADCNGSISLQNENVSECSISQIQQQNLIEKLKKFKFNEQHELYILSDLFIDFDSILGKGNFGTVYNGRVRGKDVAVKQLNNNTSVTNNSLISELEILCFIGAHPNVVSFIGAYTSEVSKGILYIVTELCCNGSLQDFLRRKKGTLFQTTNGYVDVQPDEIISFKDLFRFSFEIASGMLYIGAKHIVHSDLSARNVLLDANNICKIGDFGLARKLYEYKPYVKKSQEPLPWKWMAYESLTKMEFTSKSDVWSYGVTLWEIFSLGNVPFAGLHWTTDFSVKLKNGLRLPVPQHSTVEIYAKMLECWKLDAEERPLFLDWIKFFRNIEETSDDSSNLL